MMFDWLLDLVYLVSILCYVAAIFSVLYFFCYKTLRPKIVCPFCKEGKLRVLVRKRTLKCDNCGMEFRR